MPQNPDSMVKIISLFAVIFLWKIFCVINRAHTFSFTANLSSVWW